MPNFLEFKIRYNVPARIMYQALLDPRDIMRFTQCPAQMEAKEGGVFSIYDGMISGSNVELVEGERIVQKWRMRNWDADSDVVIKFISCGDECEVVVTQDNIPKHDKNGGLISSEELEHGWRNNIFERISKLLGYPIKI